MRKVILFIAMSLDGYIADQNSGVDWLQGQDSNQETKDIYTEFIQNIDTVIMGWNTYHQIVTELSPDQWIYSSLQSYVITHNQKESTENIQFVLQDPSDLIRELKQKEEKDIWICGGAQIIQSLMQNQMIDEYHISIIPILLGSGISLFHTGFSTIPLQLVESHENNGILNTIYVRRKETDINESCDRK